MLTTYQNRTLSEHSLPHNLPDPITEENYLPGDQVWFDIPINNPTDTPRLWGYVLRQSPSRRISGEISVVIDEVFIYGRNPNYQAGRTVQVPISSIVSRIQGPPNHPVLRITLAAGSPVDMLRIDGSIMPVCVQIEDDDGATLYEVTNSSWKVIPEK